MKQKIEIFNDEYFDSVTLMSLSSAIDGKDGVEDFVILMGTQMNKELLNFNGYEDSRINDLNENDLVIGVKGSNEEICEEMIGFIREKLYATSENQNGQKEKIYTTIDEAVDFNKALNLAIISVPGKYAVREAKKALDENIHVMLFSDNVTLADEIELKNKAKDLGLLMMGPDCGTSIINNKGLCFANEINPGNIGLVSASGTGLQEVSVLIHKFGGGISQAIGVGGRDLHKDVGGIMMIEGIKALDRDPNTNVIVLISKPPAKVVEDKILETLETVNKPVVVAFIDGDEEKITSKGYAFGLNLADTAKKAVALDKGKKVETLEYTFDKDYIKALSSKLDGDQKYVRGLYGGGTLCSEALSVFRSEGLPVFSNIAKKDHEKLEDIAESVKNTMLDLGDDYFTNGRPHPMIEPSVRLDRILQEAKEDSVGVLLMDFELGYGAHDQPIEATVESIQKAKAEMTAKGKELIIIGYICGTDLDKQGYRKSKEALEALDVILAESNYEAAKLATEIVKGVDLGE